MGPRARDSAIAAHLNPRVFNPKPFICQVWDMKSTGYCRLLGSGLTQIHLEMLRKLKDRGKNPARAH
ncbi:hypothetical protein L596_000698 [Steinernema carpocapsae]|uniref:Uncharacterized protein n=1 Tax=Steinernema carpocapsae TaxID=34508 RepID=A0A4U8UL87_STECR|nr:hypothetical protein L596_000698 [Steinernema carpocapsae]